MFKVTRAAGKELKRSLVEHEFEDMPVRVAAKRSGDGSIDYQMGFDEPGPGDTMIASGGVDVVIARDHKTLLQGAELDYVMMDDGNHHFIFKNPNDANYIAPDESEKTSSPSEDEPIDGR